MTVNALHPTSLMDTKLVREWIGTPRTSVEEGARHVECLAVSPDLDGLSGHYFEQDQRSRALAQAYDEKSLRRLRELSLGWTGLDARSGNKLG